MPEDGCEAVLAVDPDNCRACGRSCDGTRCIDGRCAPLSLTTSGLLVYDIVAHAGRVYWGSSFNGVTLEPSQVRSVAKTGNDHDVVTLDTDAPAGVAVDGDYAYYTNLFGPRGVMRAHLLSDKTESVAPAESGDDTNKVIVDGGFVYYTAVTFVGRVSVTGVGLTKLGVGTGRRQTIDADVDRIWWAVSANDPPTDQPGDMGVWSMLKDGTDVKREVDEATKCVRVHGDWVYWQSSDASRIRRRAKAGGPSTDVVIGPKPISTFRVDADGIFWAAKSSATGMVGRSDHDGTNAILLAVDQPEPADMGTLSAIALDADHVYWVAGHELLSTPK
jgi:hypothetical protein